METLNDRVREALRRYRNAFDTEPTRIDNIIESTFHEREEPYIRENIERILKETQLGANEDQRKFIKYYLKIKWVSENTEYAVYKTITRQYTPLYDEILRQYDSAAVDDSDDVRGRGKNEKTTWMEFLQSYRNKHKTKSLKECMKDASVEWKKLKNK